MALALGHPSVLPRKECGEMDTSHLLDNLKHRNGRSEISRGSREKTNHHVIVQEFNGKVQGYIRNQARAKRYMSGEITAKDFERV